MRKLILFLSFALLAGACGPGYYYAGAGSYGYRTPSVIYAYGDGSCEANGRWYPQCPWYVGPYAGYYSYDNGGWQYRQSAYPQRVRIYPRSGHYYRYYRQPTVRDHRRYRAPAQPPRVRDHRRGAPGPRVRGRRR